MSVAAIAYREAVTITPALNAPSTHGFATRLRQTMAVADDVVMLVLLVFCVPFVILGVGIPIALLIQLLLWIARLF